MYYSDAQEILYALLDDYVAYMNDEFTRQSDPVRHNRLISTRVAVIELIQAHGDEFNKLFGYIASIPVKELSDAS